MEKVQKELDDWTPLPHVLQKCVSEYAVDLLWISTPFEIRYNYSFGENTSNLEKRMWKSHPMVPGTDEDTNELKHAIFCGMVRAGEWIFAYCRRKLYRAHLSTLSHTWEKVDFPHVEQTYVDMACLKDRYLYFFYTQGPAMVYDCHERTWKTKEEINPWGRTF